MDHVSINEIEVFARHGVFEEEKRIGQKFVISVKLGLDTRKSGKSDDINDAVNYAEVCQLVSEVASENCFDLIEKLAEEIAHEILLEFDDVRTVGIRIDKPDAPIMLRAFRSVSVEIERARHTAYIGIGSNVGDSEEIMNTAIRKLDLTRDNKVTEVSDFIVTKPYGGVEQDDFLNGAFKIETLLTPEELLEKLNELEAEAGRVRTVHWGPRTLDLDILFYDNEVIDNKRLHIPHIDMQNRDFTLIPMRQLAPYLRHPVLNKTMEQLCDELGV